MMLTVYQYELKTFRFSRTDYRSLEPKKRHFEEDWSQAAKTTKPISISRPETQEKASLYYGCLLACSQAEDDIDM